MDQMDVSRAQFGIRERGDVHRDLLQEGTFEDTRAGKLLGQRPPQFPVQEFRRERFVGTQPVQGDGGTSSTWFRFNSISSVS